MLESFKKSVTYRGKCVICGDSTVGKTALSQVYCSDGAQYPKNYTMTTGVDLTVKNIHIPDTPDSIELFLYDTAGKETFQDLVKNHMQGAELAIYVFDLTNDTSFKSVVTWHQTIEKMNSGKVIPGVLIGNKSDLSERQVITNDMGELLAAKLALKFFSCSAKEMDKVEAPFVHLAKEFHTLKSTTPTL